MGKAEPEFTDWRGLRLALGLYQREMARLMGYAYADEIWRIEHGRTPRSFHVEKLRRRLSKPKWRERLEQAGYNYPYAKDWADEPIH